ncbi:MAG TPA: DUF4249 family protein [Bacteroidales bacterium]
MKRILFFLILVAGVFSIYRCSNEVDLYADYKDITIVYGLLDISDDTTWIKITKAFLGPGNALDIAKDPDSSNYPYKLNASLTGRKNSVDQPPIYLDTITIRNKKAGDSIFYYPDQLMYFTTEPIDGNAVYTLKIEDADHTIQAQSSVINDFQIVQPVNRISFTSTYGEIEWSSAKNGKRYEVGLVFNYTEWAPGYADTLALQMYWFLGVELSNDIDGGEILQIGYAGDGFYSRVAAELPAIENVKRWAGTVDVIISAATQEFHTYIEVNGANGNLLQEVPIYTNVDNGIGIFGSRHTINKPFRLSVQSENKLVAMGLGFQLPTN